MWLKFYVFGILVIASNSLFSLDYDRFLLLQNANKYVGIIENKGNDNRGDSIDKFNRFVGVAVGSSYCCSFISYMLSKQTSTFKKSASCYNFSVSNKLEKWLKHYDNGLLTEGGILVWQRANRTGHIAIIEKKSYKKNIVMTIEGNTSADNSSPDGKNNKGKQGVFRKIRDLSKPLIVGCDLTFYW